MKRKIITFYRKALWLYTLLIFILAVIAINQPDSTINDTYILIFRLDYLVHFALFIPWMWLVWNAYEVNFKSNFLKAFFWVLVGLAIAGLSEGTQYFLPYRTFNINDLLANSIGVLLGSLFFTLPFRVKVERGG